MKVRRRNKRCIVCNKLTKRGGLHCSLSCWNVTNKEKLTKNHTAYIRRKRNAIRR
jgi:predicted nucleic acid-binding Zn ribbon protein